jgi:hypothetical protein
MNHIEATEAVKNWGKFASLIESYSDQPWIYRGVPDSSFQLLPKIGRQESRKNPADGTPARYSAEDEQKLAREFERTAQPYFSRSMDNSLELLAVAQHHGLATRLLDWTENPLVAAFFACERSGTMRNPPAIYAVCDLPVLGGTEDPFKLDELSVYRPPHISPRIPAQRAVFTVHPTPSEDEFKAPQLRKWELTGKGRDVFWLKQILDSSAINRAALFPDLDGLADYMNWRYKWGKI